MCIFKAAIRYESVIHHYYKTFRVKGKYYHLFINEDETEFVVIYEPSVNQIHEGEKAVIIDKRYYLLLTDEKIMTIICEKINKEEREGIKITYIS